MSISACPRCRYQSYELLKTYAHCINCNYFFDFSEEAKNEERLREAVTFLKAGHKRKKADQPVQKVVIVPPVCPPINAMMF